HVDVREMPAQETADRRTRQAHAQGGGHDPPLSGAGAGGRAMGVGQRLAVDVKSRNILSLEAVRVQALDRLFGGGERIEFRGHDHAHLSLPRGRVCPASWFRPVPAVPSRPWIRTWIWMRPSAR